MSQSASVHTLSGGFDPADYDIIDYLDNKTPEYCGGPVEAWRHVVNAFMDDMRRILGDDWRQKAHQCVHCHNGLVRYITVCIHRPTGERVVFGSDCTERLNFPNRNALKVELLKKRAAAHADSLRVWRQREAFVATHPVIGSAIESMSQELHKDNHFVADVLRKLDQYGSLSDKQVAAVERSLSRDRERAAAKEAEASAPPAGPAPQGRQAMIVNVLGIKEQEGYFYDTTVLKALVQFENGSKGYVTVASGSEIERGKSYKLTATWTPKDTDKTFAYGKRPIWTRG